MNWIKNFVRPKIRSLLGQKRDTPENMWIKDPESGQMVFYRDLELNQFVFPGSEHHHRMPAEARMKAVFDGEHWEKITFPTVPVDPLKFRDERKYADRLKEAKSKTEADDSIRAGYGKVDGQDMVVMVQDMGFIGGSLGMAAGEAIIAAMRVAVQKKCPCVIFVASGGARMQEGILSLMQMPRTTIAVQELRAAKLPYIVVLTNPTTGGVTASYAMLGDVQLAEPNALIGFAGQRVIEQTIREKLPEGFQRSDYLRDHGMVDMVVHRHQMKATISTIARILMKAPTPLTQNALVPA
ncbi:MAG: acetyl-CoA carboxylase carboxyltransferase subunit beta [Phyllobacteriaceae bacterium]|nr:acetyl-CoA carboxylase carboxyltransferase subunit beta [Phyllobacteriaceae bacterium]